MLADGVNSIIACLCGASYRPTLTPPILPQPPAITPAISRNLASDLTSKAPAEQRLFSRLLISPSHRLAA